MKRSDRLRKWKEFKKRIKDLNDRGKLRGRSDDLDELIRRYDEAEDETLLLSDEEWEQMIELETNPPEPNDSLKKLIKP